MSPQQTWGRSQRPVLRATRHAVSAGHPMAATAGFQILEAGGNAIDAGVAAALATNVLQSELTGIAGIAPAVVYLADSGNALRSPVRCSGTRQSLSWMRRCPRSMPKVKA